MDYQEKFIETVKGRTAVYLDVANLERCVQKMYVNPKDVPDALQSVTASDLCWRVNYESLKDFFEKRNLLKSLRKQKRN